MKWSEQVREMNEMIEMDEWMNEWDETALQQMNEMKWKGPGSPWLKQRTGRGSYCFQKR